MAADDLTDEERAYFKVGDLAQDLSEACRALSSFDTDVGRGALPYAMNTLMTCLWDQFYSQGEIRSAYLEALADMNRYAAGQERR